MDNFFQNIVAFFKRLSIGQRVALTFVVLGGIAFLITATYLIQRTEYSLLFGNLPEASASEVVEVLKAENIDYELKQGGTSVYVPADQVYDLRLRFAREGIISDGTTGYEIFDQSSFGMTDFMQKLNLKRALEGELARTISNIELVRAARVHLVMPERSPFRETQTDATASVVLELKPGARLSLTHTEGIIALVAGAVEGLAPGDVNILDTNGQMLSDPVTDDPDTRLSSNQLRLQTEKEAYLTNKAQTLLDEMLGPGNAIIRLNVELDFSRAVTESSTIDPESQTVIAEERLQEEGDIDNASSSVKNYEISRSVETVEKSVGEIAYLSTSVILNYKRLPAAEDAENASPVYEPHADGEVDQIELLVKEAVGWRAERNDGFAISQIRFDTSADEQMAEAFAAQRQRDQIELFIRYGLMALALGLAAWLIKSASHRAREAMEEKQQLALREAQAAEAAKLASVSPSGQLIPGSGTASGPEEELILVDDIYTSKLSPEAKKRLKAKQQLLEEVRETLIQHPTESAELMRAWLLQDMIAKANEKAAAAAEE